MATAVSLEMIQQQLVVVVGSTRGYHAWTKGISSVAAGASERLTHAY